MKKILVKTLAILFLLCASMVFFTACGGEETLEHVHEFDRVVVKGEFKKSDATCTEKAKYFYSCECGEAGKEMFEIGEISDHIAKWIVLKDSTKTEKGYQQKECSICEEVLAYYETPYFVFELDNKLNGMILKTGANESDIIIPATYANIPVVAIDKYAFRYCSNLTSIVIPDSVTSIGYSAFNACYKLVEVYNKSSLNITAGSYDYGYVGYYALAVYTQPYTSKLSTDSNGYIIYTDGEHKILVGYVGNETDLVLPNGITNIYKYAFYNCYYLTSIVIPDSVTSIGDYAFCNCFNLTSIIIPDSVTSIGFWAFEGCSNLTSIIIPDGVTSIGDFAFSGCSNLTNVTIGNNVTSIGFWAFYGCDSLVAIYCVAESKPIGWSSSWNYECSAEVIWGYKG